MKYQTVIKILTDAESEHEATDIAGEFLRGNLETGIRMKCCTKPLKSCRLFRVSALLLLIFAFIGIASLGYFKSTATSFPGIKNTSAFQPPLKTSQTIEFKKDWQEEKNRKVLEYIKK